MTRMFRQSFRFFHSAPCALRHAQKLSCSLFTAYCLLFTVPLHAQTSGDRYVVLIAGLGGSQEYKDKFHKYLYDVRKVLVERFEFENANIFALAESNPENESFINGLSNAEGIKEQFSKLANIAPAESDIYIMLFGHGSFDGKNAALNIPRRDLKDADYHEIITSLNARRVVFVNTSSCSGPFIDHLSTGGRVVITATRSGGERNETAFPRFLVEALQSPSSDVDKNGQVSVLEIFQAAAGLTNRWYEEENHLATEHAILEDTGDKRGYQVDDLLDNGEGAFAATIYLTSPSPVAAAAAADGDTLLTGLFQEKQEIENRIMTLRMDKSQLSEPDYLARLEPLFVRLALINEELEKAEGSSQQN